MSSDITIPDGWVDTRIDKITLPVMKIDRATHATKHILYIDISGIDNNNYRIESHKEYALKNAPSRASPSFEYTDNNAIKNIWLACYRRLSSYGTISQNEKLTYCFYWL